MDVAEGVTSWQPATIGQNGESLHWISSYAISERIESVHLAVLLYVRSCHGSPLNE